ncbi:hypothetical protein ACFQ1E_03790 [Sphingomonas canadensis]|uniref:CBM-cenC domain-containing protein n=1 Tax=Sphingomonas canadensis TaxID=1219257 RepID=A0ABW3H1W5_9SPHN|nr:hypothetical protein [Sphingomonas canadensis]MCW3834635.1 hypothetical protein [Sphingomonas canadensis]
MKLRMGFALGMLALAAALPAVAPAAAQDAEAEAANRIINNSRPDSFQVFGLKQAPRAHKDPSVQEGRALRLALPGGGGDPWRIGINVPILAPVKAGDRIVIYFWARAEKLEDGKATARIAAAQLQLARDPYTPVFAGSAEATGEWKLFQVQGRADRDYAKGDLCVGFHLNTGAHTIDIGPVAAMNMGQ